MLIPVSVACLLLQLSVRTFAAATWPSSYDELEDIMLLNQGYKSRQLSLPVTPCDFQRAPGFIPAAGFLRTAFHDVAPHDASTGQGGLDASIAFELTGEAGKDNAGPFVNNTLTFLSRYYSTQASMSDLLSLAVYTAVRGCGGPSIPVRTGRKDAQAAGALGVPKVEGTQQDFKRDFTRMGFTTQQMVKLVACGHTLGGVHSAQFPQIVANGTQPNNVQNFDRSPAVYDNAVAVDFVNNNSVNPLVVGPERTNADTKVYTADGGVTIRQLTDAQTYQDSCKVILQKMLETVPADNTLTEPIEVYDIKPGSLQLTVASDGTSLNFTGEVRIRTTNRPQSSIGSVVISYKTASGDKGESIASSVVGTAAGYDESFTFYAFSAAVDMKKSISSFNVIVTNTDGSSQTFDNNGKGYPVQDSIFLQHPKCSVGPVDAGGNQLVKVAIAVKGSASKVSLSAHLQTPRVVPFPLLTTEDVPLSMEDKTSEYTFYSGTFSITAAQMNSTTFDISAILDEKAVKSPFHKISGFGPPSPDKGHDNSESSSTISSSTTIAKTSSTATAPGTVETAGGSSTTPTSNSSAVSSPWTDWSRPVSSAITDPIYPTNEPKRPQKPCGPEEGCDAVEWATETVWVVPTPGPLSHTKPPGVGIDKPALGVDHAGAVDQALRPFATTGSAPVAPTKLSTLDSQASGVGNKPVSPSSPVSPFTGDASRLTAGFATAIGILCAMLN